MQKQKGKQMVECTICDTVLQNETMGKHKNTGITKHLMTAHEDKYLALTGKKIASTDERKERFERFRKQHRKKNITITYKLLHTA